MSLAMHRSLFDFDTVADRYDKWYDEPAGKTYDRLERRAIRRFLPQSGKDGRLVDVGCGTGHWMELFAGMGFHVVGVDVSNEMIRRAASRRMGDASLVRGDAMRLPLKSSSFEVACAITLLEFVADPAAVVREMRRIVRPGGLIVVGVLNRFSLLSFRRRLKRSLVFENARFISPRQVRALLSPHGRVTVRSVAFVLPWRRLLWLSYATDVLGRALRLPFGDFVVGVAQV